MKIRPLYQNNVITGINFKKQNSKNIVNCFFYKFDKYERTNIDTL